jgi:hypothetical protein
MPSRTLSNATISIVGISPETLLVAGETNESPPVVAVNVKMTIIARVRDELHSISVQSTLNPDLVISDCQRTIGPFDLRD